MQYKPIREKAIQSYYKNSSQAASKQQLYINNLYQGELNYPCEYYSLDIALLDDNIDFEVDFGGHDLSVKLGSITQEEFNKKEIIRNNIVKRNGYKIVRLISRKDKLPSDSKLLEILEFSKEYFKTEHTWINWDIDESKYYNAEHRDGVLFDFGELRTFSRNTQSA